MNSWMRAAGIGKFSPMNAFFLKKIANEAFFKCVKYAYKCKITLQLEASLLTSGWHFVLQIFFAAGTPSAENINSNLLFIFYYKRYLLQMLSFSVGWRKVGWTIEGAPGACRL